MALPNFKQFQSTATIGTGINFGLEQRVSTLPDFSRLSLEVSSIPTFNQEEQKEIDAKLKISKTELEKELPFLKPIIAEALPTASTPEKVARAVGRFVVAPFEPLKRTIQEMAVMDRVAKKVADGELPVEILDYFSIMTKKPHQHIGDVAQAVLAVFPFARGYQMVRAAPTIGSKIIAGSVIGGKTGALFGTAMTLSDDPDIKATNIIVNAGLGAGAGIIMGGVLTTSGLITKAGYDILKTRIIGKPNPNLQPNIIEIAFPKLYQKRLGISDNITRSELSIIQKALQPITPQRVLLSKNPTANYTRMELQNAMLNQKNAFDALYDQNWKILEKYSLADRQKIFDLQDAGALINKVPKNLRTGLTALRKLEKKGFGMAQELGIDTSKWRFNINNHISRMYRGSQVLVEETKKGEIKRIISFANNRVDGMQKMYNYLKNNPASLISLRPRYEIYPKPDAVPLTRAGWFSLQNKIAKKLKITPAELSDEINMQGIAFIKKPRTKIGQLLYRKGETEGYLKDPLKIYPSLWWKMTKAIHIDPVTSKAMNRLSKIKDPTIRHLTEDLINTVGGKYKEQLLPYNATKVITGTQAQFKLGLRISPPIVNTFQRLYGVSLSGTKNFAKAQKNVFTKEGQKILEKIGVSVEAPLYETLDRGIPKSVLNPLWAFGKTESGKYIGNRNAVALANWYKGLELPLKKINKNLVKIGLPTFKNQEELALMYAREAVTVTQFRYDISDFPALMRSNIGKTMLQFKTYGLNQLANWSRVVQGKPLAGMEIFYPQGLTKAEAMKQAIVYLGVTFSQGGLRAASFGFERLLPIGLLFKLVNDYPAALYGVSSFLGVDISRSATIEAENLNPFDFKNYVPLSDLEKIYTAIVDNNPKKLLEIYPALYRIVRGLDALENDQWLRDMKTNQKIIKLDKKEIALYMLGLNPLRVSKEQDIHFINLKQGTEGTKKLSKAKIELIKAIKDKDADKFAEIIENLAKDKLYIRPSDIIEGIKRFEMPRYLRDLEDIRKTIKPDVLKRIQDAYKDLK